MKELGFVPSFINLMFVLVRIIMRLNKDTNTIYTNDKYQNPINVLTKYFYNAKIYVY